MEIVILISINAFLIGSFILIPFVYVLRNGKLVKGTLMSWGLMILSFTIISMPVADLVYHLNQDFIHLFPEANSVVASLLLGWIYGFLVASLAIILRFLLIKYKPITFLKNKESLIN